MVLGIKQKCFYFCAFICNKLMFLMKSKIVLFVAGCCAWLFSSCLGSDDYTPIGIAPNCQISSFSLKSDSVASVEKLKFTIDQLNGLIFNVDSLPCGTKLKDKMIATIGYKNSSAVQSLQVRPMATNDTIWWSGSDSLDFSKPVYFKVLAFDGMTSKEYKAWINVHQQVPDSMEWGMFATPLPNETIAEQKVVAFTRNNEASYYMYMRPANESGYKLFQSSTKDVKNWNELSLQGLPSADVCIAQIMEYQGAMYVPTRSGALYTSVDGQEWKQVENAPVVKYLFGKVNAGEKQKSVMAVAVESEGRLCYAAMDEHAEWAMGEEISAGFPLTGFGVATYSAMYHEYLLLVAGRDKDNQLLNTAWGTMDGLKWSCLSNEDVDTFVPREGVMLTPYDDKLYLLGGMDASGKGYKDMYTSTDYGVTWSLVDTLVVLPKEFEGRGFSSVQVNEDQFMFIFGGKTTKGQAEENEIWRGRINRLGFEK